MATHPMPKPTEQDQPLTREQAFDLLESLYGSLQDWRSEDGLTASESLQRDRDDWGAGVPHLRREAAKVGIARG